MGVFFSHLVLFLRHVSDMCTMSGIVAGMRSCTMQRAGELDDGRGRMVGVETFEEWR